MTIHILDERGPTAERLAKSAGDFVIGDDRRGTRIYAFRDTPVYRLYKRLGVEDKSSDAQEQLQKEYAALMRYRHHWAGAHLAGSVRAIDLDRVQTSGNSENASEAAARHSIAYRRMVRLIGIMQSHVVEQIVCMERSTTDCSWLGAPMSRYRAVDMLREAAAILAGDR